MSLYRTYLSTSPWWTSFSRLDFALDEGFLEVVGGRSDLDVDNGAGGGALCLAGAPSLHPSRRNPRRVVGVLVEEIKEKANDKTDLGHSCGHNFGRLEQNGQPRVLQYCISETYGGDMSRVALLSTVATANRRVLVRFLMWTANPDRR
jgi:hypothetical protein